jgi:hypothetical protein
MFGGVVPDQVMRDGESRNNVVDWIGNSYNFTGTKGAAEKFGAGWNADH